MWHAQGEKWMAYIWANGKQQHIGLYDDEDGAARAYNERARELFGAAAVVNDVDAAPRPARAAEKAKESKNRSKSSLLPGIAKIEADFETLAATRGSALYDATHIAHDHRAEVPRAVGTSLTDYVHDMMRVVFDSPSRPLKAYTYRLEASGVAGEERSSECDARIASSRQGTSTL